LDVVRGTRARWKTGTRTYSVRDGDAVIAIGVMSKTADGWRLVASPGEAGAQVFARTPRPAPPPLWPWRAPLILAVSAGLGFGALYGAGVLLLDTPPCAEHSVLRFQIASALP